MSQAHTFDVIVVGAGNAGLLAAIAAREASCDVLLIEASPRSERGGNTRFASGVYRVAHRGTADIRALLPDSTPYQWGLIELSPYPVEQFLSDVLGSSRGFGDPGLLADVATRSFETVSWMKTHGIRWGLSLAQLPDTLRPGETVNLNPGGEVTAEGNGAAVVETLFHCAEDLGVTVRYGHPVVELVISGRTVTGVQIREEDRVQEIRAAVVVLACGGFEANTEARVRYLGPGWDLVKVRGSRYNTGLLLDKAIEIGASAAGHWSGAHAVPVDAAAPAVGDLAVGDSTARYSYPFGITVNLDGHRFFDEGEDALQFTYAEVGRKVLSQPGAEAYQLFDKTGSALLEPRYDTAQPVEADTIEGLAVAIGVAPAQLATTVRNYNAACSDGHFDPSAKDGLRCIPGGQPPKSNWATPLTTPPYRAYRIACGITFTFGGVAVDSDTRVLGTDGRPIPGLLAVGEIAGGFFAYNVPTGSGLIRGAVCGRIAGQTAARLAGVSS